MTAGTPDNEPDEPTRDSPGEGAPASPPDLGSTAAAATPPPLPSPESTLDPRRYAVRPDLAALSLRAHVVSPRYSAGIIRQIVRPAVPVRRNPRPDIGLDTEVLFGELVTVYDEAEGWSWVQLHRDRYVGYIPSSALSAEVMQPTHRVQALGTFIYPQPDIKSPPQMHLSLNSELRIAEWGERFSRLERGGFVFTRHIAERGRYERDFVDVTERLIGTPYLWGGRTRIGIDCSGLIQVSMESAGLACPRDSDMQAGEVGQQIQVQDNLEDLKRGDLIFWKGHVGVMSDALMLVHANAHHMSVVTETIPEAAERIAKQSGPITAIRRLAAQPGVPVSGDPLAPRT